MEKDKIFKNKSGNLVVRENNGSIGFCGEVEIMHMWNKNKSGCVIGYWDFDDEGSEFHSVGNRIIETVYDNPKLLLTVLQYGMMVAEKRRKV
jgi:hypothetical protein